MLNSKDLTGLRNISSGEIDEILSLASEYKKKLASGNKVFDVLKGKTLVTLFYENSTRTRTSFELAGKYLGAHEVNISASSSSVQKGETLIEKDMPNHKVAIQLVLEALVNPEYGAIKSMNLLGRTKGAP